jgi:NAD(P)-dependent dehydrogenase (short-subunit alcohol dehydrogenase family)
VAELRAATGNPRVELLLADLASQASIRHAAEEVKRTHQRLHVLVNNAGGYWATRHRTPDRLELTSCSSSAATGVRRPTTSPSWPTCCSPTSSPAAWKAPG